MLGSISTSNTLHHLKECDTKKDGVKDSFFSLQALVKNLMPFTKGLQLVSRSCTFK